MLSEVTVSTAAEQANRVGGKERRITGTGELLMRWRRSEVPKNENLEETILSGVVRRYRDVNTQHRRRGGGF